MAKSMRHIAGLVLSELLQRALQDTTDVASKDVRRVEKSRHGRLSLCCTRDTMQMTHMLLAHVYYNMCIYIYISPHLFLHP